MNFFSLQQLMSNAVFAASEKQRRMYRDLKKTNTQRFKWELADSDVNTNAFITCTSLPSKLAVLKSMSAAADPT